MGDGDVQAQRVKLIILLLFPHRLQSSQPSFLLYLRHAFRSPQGGGGIRKRDFSAIEYMLRRGDKMMSAVFEEKGVKMISVPAGAREWWEGEVQRAKERSASGGEAQAGAKDRVKR